LSASDQATITVSGLAVGTYVFRVMVTDDRGAVSSDDVKVEVAPVATNMPPVVNASGGKIIAAPNSSTSLIGSVSDPDGFIKSVLWTQLSGPSNASMSGESNTTLLLSELQLGSYTFRLTATDNENATAFAETTVQVIAPVSQTIVFAGKDTTLVLPNNVIQLVGEILSAQSPIVSYSWTQVAGPAASIAGEYPDVSAVDLMPGGYTFRFSVTDNAGNTTFDDIVVSVIEDKSNPLGAALFFSPNDDRFNDTWEVKNLQLIQQCPIQIFNALGKKVFEAAHYDNDWGGTMNGSLLKEGDYYYVIDCGDNKTYSGALRLIR
jgi:gliding motility-associated-like protein